MKQSIATIALKANIPHCSFQVDMFYLSSLCPLCIVYAAWLVAQNTWVATEETLAQG